MRKIFISGLFLVQSLYLFSQSPAGWTSAEIYLSIKKLNVLGSVLYIAAHPDDENTRLITYLSKDRLYRTGYLSLTRGDGGQNLIGDEQGIELGLIRTEELLAARRIDGGEQFFTRAFDFGYSKNPGETFSKWDKEKILSDVVWVIRSFQPDVIITRFPSTGEGGHGHHTASAILAEEAFAAAADPGKFPEQLQYVSVWQARRIVWNSFSWGNAAREDDFKIDVGGYNPLLGKSYGEIAATSRSQHKSQGFGATATRGEAWESLRTLQGEKPTHDLLDGVDKTWKRIKGGEAIGKMIDKIAASFDFQHPEKSVQSLVQLYKTVKALPDNNWKKQKLKEITTLIEQCSGLFISAAATEKFAVQTDSVKINFSLNNRLGADVLLKRIKLDELDTALNLALSRNRNISFSRSLFVPSSKPVTQPYWLAGSMEKGSYNVRDQKLIGKPDVQPAYEAVIDVVIDGEAFQFVKPVQYRYTDPVKGEIYNPVVVAPPVLISPDAEVKISNATNSFDGVLKLTGKKKGFSTSLNGVGKEYPDETSIVYNPDRVSFEEKNKTISVGYSLKANRDNDYYFAVDANNGRKDVYHLGLHEINYDHIPGISYFSVAKTINRKLDIETYGKRIGYITGAGDKVPEALEKMGYEVTLLGDKELSRNNLAQFDAIITGVRAYNMNEWMNTHYDKLMAYVENGGHLIVQYNTSSNIGPVKAKISPYSFDISRTRVTDEEAPVNFLNPEHPVLNFPNKITSEDFKGWVQERSIYHATKWDKEKFETVLSMGDPGEKPDEGSLIIAKYGKGYFTYSGIVFFRQLPAGVPGAYRLLANIIALNGKKGF